MQQHDENNSEAEHRWYVAIWTAGSLYGVAVWICDCGAVKRVIYDPGKIEVVDPSNIQTGGGGGKWSGAV